MDCLCSPSLKAGYVAWPDGRRSLIVKLSFDVAMGQLRLSPRPAPLGLDVATPNGELSYPSDYAPFKPRCDIAVVGETAADRVAPAHLRVGVLDLAVAPHETLSARETFCAHGDPTEAAAFELWTTGGLDFSRFQIAPPQRRVPWIEGPFGINYQRGTQRIEAHHDRPLPHAALLTPDRSGPLLPIPLHLDTILLHATMPRIWMVFRGVYNHPDSGVVAIDLSTSAGKSFDTQVIASLPSVSLSPPRQRAVTQALAAPPVVADETRFLEGPVATVGLPFADSRHGAGSPALSEPPSAHPPKPPMQPAPMPIARLQPPPRTLGEKAVLNGSEMDDTSNLADRTRVAVGARPDEMSVLPFAGAKPSPSSARRPITANDIARLRLESTPSTGEGWGVDETRVLVGPRQQAEAKARASYEEVQKEVWRAEEPLLVILARHGLTEESWRALRKAHKRRT